MGKDTRTRVRLLDRWELERRRILAGYSQAELATRAGLNKSYISRLESGERDASPKTLRVLARVLRCTMTDLMTQRKRLILAAPGADPSIGEAANGDGGAS